MRKDKEYFTIDAELRSRLLRYVESGNISKSRLIESLIKDFLEKQTESGSIDNLDE